MSERGVKQQGHAPPAVHVERVIRREAPSLLAYFARRAEVQDAADLLGDTLLIAWRRAASVPRDDEEARMWMFGVARRVLSTHHRGRVRRQALMARLREELLTRSPPPSGDTHDVHSALAQLSDVDAEIIRLVHWDGFSQAEVARHLKMGASTVRSRYTRARASLRRALADAAEPADRDHGTSGAR